jgi:hypothetical protein
MKCGVSIDEEKNRVCPLCNTIILTNEEIDNLTQQNIKIQQSVKRDKKQSKEKKEKINITGFTSFIVLLSSITSIIILLIIDFLIGFNIDWSVIPIMSIILFIFLICLSYMRTFKNIYCYITIDTIVLCIYFLLLNYITSNRISWSYFVVLSIILLWFYLSTIFINKLKGFVLKISIDFLATAIFVLLVSLGYNNDSGFAKLALPINGLVFILTVISYLFIKTYIYNWRAIISTLSINVSILCFGIDLFVQRYIYDKLTLNWSYIVLIVLIPFTLFMFYLDNRYKIHIYLKKKFHI